MFLYDQKIKQTLAAKWVQHSCCFDGERKIDNAVHEQYRNGLMWETIYLPQEINTVVIGQLSQNWTHDLFNWKVSIRLGQKRKFISES
jgi:hypothetical protein